MSGSVFFSLIPSFSTTYRSQERVQSTMGQLTHQVHQQPVLWRWMREHKIDHLGIDLIYDEYKRRPLTVKVGPNWAGQAALVRVYRESWVDAPMSDDHSRAWASLIVNEALDALSVQQDFPWDVRVPVVAATPFRFVRLEVRGAVAAPGKSMSTNPSIDAWLRTARLVCDTVNQELTTTTLTSPVAPELEFVLASRGTKRNAVDQADAAAIAAPASNFADLSPEERVGLVMAAIGQQMLSRSGCDEREVDQLLRSVEHELRLHSWTLDLSSDWLTSPDGARKAQWQFRTGLSGEGLLRIEAVGRTGADATATAWSPAGPTARAVTTIAEDAFIWESDEAIEFARPHEMNPRQRPVRLEFP